MARDTSTGRVLEEMVLPPLARGGYSVRKQVNVGTRLGGGRHMADILASKGGRHVLISLKWQQVGGTAEQKVPYEFMCLAHALIENPELDSAYIVIGGTGWTKDSFFLGDLVNWVNTNEKVRVIRLDDFVARANSGAI